MGKVHPTVGWEVLRKNVELMATATFVDVNLETWGMVGSFFQRAGWTTWQY